MTKPGPGPLGCHRPPFPGACQHPQGSAGDTMATLHRRPVGPLRGITLGVVSGPSLSSPQEPISLSSFPPRTQQAELNRRPGSQPVPRPHTLQASRRGRHRGTPDSEGPQAAPLHPPGRPGVRPLLGSRTQDTPVALPSASRDQKHCLPGFARGLPWWQRTPVTLSLTTGRQASPANVNPGLSGQAQPLACPLASPLLVPSSRDSPTSSQVGVI